MRLRLKDMPAHFTLHSSCREAAEEGKEPSTPPPSSHVHWGSLSRSEGESSLIAGSWICPTCSTRNKPDALCCSMCRTPAPPHVRRRADLATARRRCRNLPCARFVDQSMRAANGSSDDDDDEDFMTPSAWELCSECYRKLVGPIADDMLGDPFDRASMQALLKRLALQYVD